MCSQMAQLVGSSLLLVLSLLSLPSATLQVAKRWSVYPSHVFFSLTNASSYDRWEIPPTSTEDGPLEVLVRAYVYHLKTKETSKLYINMQILLELSWLDPRLAYDEELVGLKAITGGGEQVNRIWAPHVIFSNEKEAKVMGSVRKDDFMSLLPSGRVTLTFRIRASMDCLLKLDNFPFDQQDCHLIMETWRYNSSDLHLVWDNDVPLQVHGISKSLAEFKVISVDSESSLEANSHRNEVEEQLYSSLTIRLKLARSSAYYFLNYYLPSVLLVIISWVSFWLEPSAIPGRVVLGPFVSCGGGWLWVVLGSATMLTFIQLCWSAQGTQKVSQFMANDIWALSCTAFIFLSLAEFAFVNTIDRKGEGSKLELKKLSSKYILRGGMDTAAGRAKLRRASSLPSSPELRRHFAQRTAPNKDKTLKELRKASLAAGSSGGPRDRRKSWIPDSHLFTMTPKEIAAWIDQKSKFIFPIAFLTFNVIYWLPLIIVNS